MSFDFDYLLLNFILLLIFCMAGHYVSKGGKYWGYAWACIASFTFVEGSRYDRGVDYMHYLDVFKYDLESDQVLFTALNRFIKALGVTDIYCFYFYAFVFILCAMVLLATMKKYAVYLFPIFIISFTVFHETFIRQALGTSFVFLYIAQLNSILSAKAARSMEYRGKGKVRNKSRKQKDTLKFIEQYGLLVILALAAYSTHSMLIITLVVMTAIFLFLHKPVKWYYTIPLMLIGKYIISKAFDWDSINGILNALGGINDKFAAYSESADRWFSEDAIKDKYTRSLPIEILETIGNCAMLYLGAKLCDGLRKRNISAYGIVHPLNKKFVRKDVLFVAMFNITAFGTIILQTFFNLELMRRIAMSWSLYWFVPIALILYYRKSKFFNKFDRVLMFALIFWIWDYFRFLFLWSSTPMFIWDI